MMEKELILSGNGIHIVKWEKNNSKSHFCEAKKYKSIG